MSSVGKGMLYIIICLLTWQWWTINLSTHTQASIPVPFSLHLHIISVYFICYVAKVIEVDSTTIEDVCSLLLYYLVPSFGKAQSTNCICVHKKAPNGSFKSNVT